MCRFRKPPCIGPGTKSVLLRAILVATTSWALTGCRKTDDPSRQVKLDESNVQQIGSFHTKAWDDVPTFRFLRFRYVDESRSDFVVAPGFSKPADKVPVDVVYLYSAREERFSAVGVQAWHGASGPVWDVYNRRRWTGDSAVRLEAPYGTYGTLYGERGAFPTAGWAVLTAVVSHEGRYVNAISAAGPRRHSYISTPTPEGPYYLQVFEVNGMRQIGPTYELLPGTSRRSWWTPDERYLIMGDRNITVLPVHKLVGER